ncbi:MAG TPA: hypothetical protein VFN78_11515, partial [Ktedonobacterales bacterium]|nr:hypothetical protein [Ktedonobacterales bacterium]
MRRLGSILTAARYIIILGIIASLALSLTMFGVIVWRTAVVILETPAAIESAKGLKLLVVECT